MLSVCHPRTHLSSLNITTSPSPLHPALNLHQAGTPALRNKLCTHARAPTVVLGVTTITFILNKPNTEFGQTNY